MKEISNNVLLVLVVIAIVFSVASTAMLWSATQVGVPTTTAETGPSQQTAQVKLNVIGNESANETPEGGSENGE